MQRICVDNHVIVWGIRKYAETDQQDMIPRASHFLEECKKKHIEIIVPSIVLGEFLGGIDRKKRYAAMSLFSSGFVVVPYDAMCALRFAELWEKNKETGVIKALRAEGISRQELKADSMILATAIAHKAKAIYSHDDGLTKFANGEIEVLELPNLPKMHIQETLNLHVPDSNAIANLTAGPQTAPN